MCRKSQVLLSLRATQCQEVASPRAHRFAELREWPAEELARIRVVLRKLTALRIDNPEDAEDLVQETLLTMTEKCPEIELEKGLLVWGMGILRKKVGNYYRREQRYSALRREFLSDVMLYLTRLRPRQNRPCTSGNCELWSTRFSKNFRLTSEPLWNSWFPGSRSMRLRGHCIPERYQNIVNRVHRGRKRLHKELAKYGYETCDRKKGRKQGKQEPENS